MLLSPVTELKNASFDTVGECVGGKRPNDLEAGKVESVRPFEQALVSREECLNDKGCIISPIYPLLENLSLSDLIQIKIRLTVVFYSSKGVFLQEENKIRLFLKVVGSLHKVGGG